LKSQETTGSDVNANAFLGASFTGLPLVNITVDSKLISLMDDPSITLGQKIEGKDLPIGWNVWATEALDGPTVVAGAHVDYSTNLSEKASVGGEVNAEAQVVDEVDFHGVGVAAWYKYQFNGNLSTQLKLSVGDIGKDGADIQPVVNWTMNFSF